MPRGARIPAVGGAGVGGGRKWAGRPLEMLPALPGPRPGLSLPVGGAGGERFEGPGRTGPLLSQCEQCPEPPSGEGCPERWSRWPGREHEAVSSLYDQLGSFRAGAATSGRAGLRPPPATR